MLSCWACNHILSGEPDLHQGSEEDEEPDLVATCPKCLTRHVYIEDEDGNMAITQAEKTDGSILERPTAPESAR